MSGKNIGLSVIHIESGGVDIGLEVVLIGLREVHIELSEVHFLAYPGIFGWSRGRLGECQWGATK